MSDNSDRTGFESWARSLGMSVERVPEPLHLGYTAHATEYAWRGWQARYGSMIRRAAPVPEGPDALDAKRLDWLEANNGAWMDRFICYGAWAARCIKEAPSLRSAIDSAMSALPPPPSSATTKETP